MNNQKGWASVIIILIIIVFAGGILGWQYLKKTEVKPLEELQEENSKTETEQIKEFFSECETKPDQISKDKCYYSSALLRVSLSTCEKIKDQKLKSECITTVKKLEELKEGTAAKKVRDKKRSSDLYSLKIALQFYYREHGSYPILNDTSEDGEFLNVLSGIIKYLPIDPKHPIYYYEYYGSKNSYTLKCYLEIEGGFTDMLDGKKDGAYTIVQ